MLPDLTVAVVYPELLGLYADSGNALALRHRAGLRGIGCTVLDVAVDQAIPDSADLYLIGGGEDAAIRPAAERLRADTGLTRAAARGAIVLGVCAGFQLLGERLDGPDGRPVQGLGLLDVESRTLPGPRAVGEVLAVSPDLGELQGFENHRGDARLGPGARPLGILRHGVGNGHGDGEGAIAGNLFGTYLHGPVLVRNPDFADHLLSAAVGTQLPPLADDADELVERLRAERRAAIAHARIPQGRLMKRSDAVPSL